MATAEATIRTALSGLDTAIRVAERWRDKADDLIPGTNHPSYRALQHDRDRLRELRVTLQAADRLMEDLRGRCWCHTTVDREIEDDEQRCRCGDPGAMPPCGFCVQGG